ncbi:MAG: thiamine pyrophosphate-dependent enzyme, partial [Dehalococcoidales bacterium]|nr:thiamine pyrophosphate-dependent enzyme [Dehalococcoidales bacterium]
YRYRGHFEGDAGTYRPREEIEKWLARDPINIFREQLTKTQMLTEKQVAEIDKEALEEVAKAVQFAKESPFPKPEETLDNVYA